jgi:hypothetical protein
MKSILIRLAVAGTFIVVIIAWYVIPDSVFIEYSDASLDKQTIYSQEQETKTQKQAIKQKKEIQETRIEKVKEVDKIKHSVPFIVQAPHAQWDDKKYQDACEEASILMANAWLNDKRNISKNDAEEEMEKMFEKQKEMFGEDVVDTSAEDTAKLLKEYYNQDSRVVKSVTMKDLYDFLIDGNIVIAPTNGKWLENPNFSNGGPDRHMVVITGFDKKNREFITNDPGTRLGRGYKYKDSVLYNAIRDYKTGHKEDIEGVQKTVIVVNK